MVVTLAICSCEPDSTAGERIDKAKRLVSSGEFRAGTIELKNLLLVNGDNVEARLLLANLNYDLGDFVAAEDDVKKVIAQGVSAELVKPLLSKILFLQGRYETLLTMSSSGLGAEDESVVLASQGLAEAFLGEHRKAERLIERALHIDPESAYSLVARAQIFLALNDLVKAKSFLDKALKVDAESPLALALLGDLEVKNNNFKSAVELYSKAFHYQPLNFSVLFRRASAYIYAKDYVNAAVDVATVIKAYPNSTAVNYLKGIVLFNEDDLVAAESAFSVAAQDSTRLPLSLYYLSLINVINGNKVQAEVYAEHFLSLDYESDVARRLLAIIKLDRFEYSEAEELIRPVAENGQAVYDINILADSLMNQGKVRLGVAVLDTALAVDPLSSKARVRFGAGLIAAGYEAEGVAHLERVIGTDPLYDQAVVLLINHFIKENKYTKAMSSVESFISRSPESVDAYNLLGKLLLLQGRDPQAYKAFSKARGLSLGDPYASQNLAYLKIKDKDFKSARLFYNEVIEVYPENISVLMKLASLSELEGDVKGMLVVLKSTITKHPQAIEPKLKLSSYYLFHGESEKVPVVFDGVAGEDRLNPSILKVLSLSHLERSQFGMAEFYLEKLIDLEPDSASVRYHMARVYAGKGLVDKVKPELEASIEADEAYYPARLALARLLIAQGDKDKASFQFSTLEKLAPKNPDVLQVKAMLSHLNGDSEAALDIAESSFLNNPTASNLMFLGNQKWISGDSYGAQSISESWLKDHPDDGDVRMALAVSYTVQNKNKEAVDHYNSILNGDPENVMALNNLAWLLRDSDPGKAVEYASRARTIRPESASVLDTLAVALLKDGKFKNARRTIDRALEKNSKNMSIRYHSAMIDASSGDSDSAMKELVVLLDEAGDFSERDDASRLLSKLRNDG